MRLLYLLLFHFILPNVNFAQQTLPSNFQTSNPPTGFLKNSGQVRDFKNNPVPSVLYQANIGGQQVYITKTGLSILLARPKKIIKVNALPGDFKSSLRTAFDSTTVITWEMERIDIVLKGATVNESNLVPTKDELSPYFNFYLKTSDTVAHKEFSNKEILVRNVYPGIDWRVYINQDKNKQSYLKYDFIVHAGANPTQIKLQYSNNAKLEAIGQEMIATTKMGKINEKKPYSYLAENNHEINVAYQLNKNEIKFHVSDYDTAKTLVIDPSVFWLTYLSSTNLVYNYNSINGHDVETDAAGNIFVQLSAAGNVPFPTLNPGGGAYFQNHTASPDNSMIIIKFSPGGQMLWSTYFGNAVAGWLMSIDKFGNIIAVGRNVYSTPTNPVTNPTIPLLNNGGFYDAAKKMYFITKFSNNGNLLWSTYYADFSSYPMDMTYDLNGNFYIVGWSEFHNFPVVDPGNGAYVVTNPQHGAQQVLFISQFNATNQLTWSTRVEGNSYDPMARVCTDNVGNIYLGGQTRSTNYPMVNAGGYFNTSPLGSVLTRFNSARQMTWSTYIPSMYGFQDLTTDDSSNLYVAADQRIFKFDSNTHLKFTKAINTSRLYFWNKINYDPHLDQIHLLGVMNDFEYDFPGLNTACNGSFFNTGTNPNNHNSATSPIFATINHDGVFNYLSLADWPYEYYHYNETTIDRNGDLIYLFGHQANSVPNPNLTNPGNGAYFDTNCCFMSNGNRSALLMKLNASELEVTTQLVQSTGCSCNGSATAIPSCGAAPFTYLWSNGATTATSAGLCPGTYWVKVTDANNLSRTVYVTIASPPGSITSLTSDIIPENCNKSNGVIKIQSIQGGIAPFTYSIDGINFTPVSQFNGLVSGSYIVRIKDGNGCMFNDTLTVSEISGPANVTYATQKSSCSVADGQIRVNSVQGGVGPYIYSITGIGSNTTGLFTNLPAATYQLMVADTAGCTLSRTIDVVKSSPPSAVAFEIGNDHCNQSIGFIEVINVTGGIAPYLFSKDSITFGNGPVNTLAAGSYSLYVKDSRGCTLKKEVVITNEAGPNDLTIMTTQAYCGKLTGTATIVSVSGGSGTYAYSVDGGPYTSDFNFTSLQPGTHEAIVKDAFNCTYRKNFEIYFRPVPNIRLSPSDTLICYDEMISLNITGDISQAQSITWNIQAQGNSAVLRPTEDQIVYVLVKDFNNCLLSDTSFIKVKDCNTPDKCLVIPNAFTPNNDGTNEVFKPITNGCRLEEISFRIYDRWGELVFESTNLSTGWNGKYKGVPGPAGAYIYVCSYVAEDGLSRMKKGAFMLLR